ncbi:HRDC domain-containing protein [Granulicoccus phenolivorans]|uniref:HRDC domain-containing protein n=1 Tax=Granulicoccus phenolivorans TaxID=266854 RepID=UPI000419B053|nr:HRDC domain-containing protein [Granulicoccus phenolivorans]
MSAHDPSEGTSAEVELPVLAEPADGVPPVVATADALADSIEALAAGSGPVAIDAERAQGFRYSARAYLIQLRRAGAGTHLIDPDALAPEPKDVDDPALADLAPLGSAIQDAQWIIHAATQDTPCLAEVGLVPTSLFDTELAGRLLGYPKVGLGALIERFFGVRLLKEHSAADWSSRPLPHDWLNYASLDVELLVELRDRLAEELTGASKDEWARQEFAHLAALAARPPQVRQDPWRRTSGIHSVRTGVGLAIVRELWQTRDEIARRLDRAPGRVLQDVAITELAGKPKPGRTELRDVAGFHRRTAKRYETEWLDALERAQRLPRAELPPVHLPPDGPPPPRSWESKDPAAYARFVPMRATMGELATELQLPPENLLTPDYWRRLAWQPPEATEPAVDDFLAALGARPWQREIVVGPLTRIIAEQGGPSGG